MKRHLASPVINKANKKQRQFLYFPLRVGKMTETATTPFGKGAGTPDTSMLGTEE